MSYNFQGIFCDFLGLQNPRHIFVIYVYSLKFVTHKVNRGSFISYNADGAFNYAAPSVSTHNSRLIHLTAAKSARRPPYWLSTSVDLMRKPSTNRRVYPSGVGYIQQL